MQQIYDRIITANGLSAVPISVESGVLDTCSLACTDRSSITVTVELLAIVKNEDELAGVIGHEIAHMLYKDELKADKQGLLYAKKAGYNYCKAAQFLKNYLEDDTHPSGAVRYKNSGCP